jgi:hypothetical protein
MYCHQPQSWTPTDLEEASIAVESFLNTKGYQWIASYVGTRQRVIAKDMCPTRPSDKSHGHFIENSARYGELEDLMAAIASIVKYKEIKNAEKEAGDRQ